MWPFKKQTKQHNVIERIENSTERKPIDDKPLVFMEMLVINNRTDKKYHYISETELGLSWHYFDNSQLLVLKQVTGPEEKDWKVKAHLKDFSILSFKTA